MSVIALADPLYTISLSESVVLQHGTAKGKFHQYIDFFGLRSHATGQQMYQDNL